MGNLFCSAATVPSSPPPLPHVIERTTPALVPSAELSLVQSVAAPKRSNRSDSRPTSPEQSKSGVGASTMSYPNRRPLDSTVKQVLTDHPEIRILVVGKRGCGKSSLINAAFGVDMSLAAGPSRASGVNFAFHPDDNHRLIVHGCSGLEPGDAQGLRTILNFISNRTDPSSAVSEKLHAIWICVPTSKAIEGSIGEGVEEIEHEKRYKACGQLYRPLFRGEPRDVPAVLVSAMPQFGAFIDDLIVTTDRFVMGLRTVPAPSARSTSQGMMSRTAPVPLAWSVALRASRDITIRASIEIGRSRYWCKLGSSLDFTDQTTLKDCVDIVYVDIVEIWNLYDRDRYLSSTQFKKNMSHVVEDLAVPGSASPSPDRGGSGDEFANWVNDVYERSEKNVRCVMGYIVSLTVILDDIDRTAAGNVTENAALKVLGAYVGSGRRDGIHQDIRDFVQFAIEFPVPQKDLVLEKIVDLIRRHCPRQ